MINEASPLTGEDTEARANVSSGLMALEGDRSSASRPWIILLADADAGARLQMQSMLDGASVLGRPLKALFASSAQEGWSAVQSSPEICVAVLDVALETPEAGLELALKIRSDPSKEAMRIIVRSPSQGGALRESEAIARHDIHDYKMKGELTRGWLMASLTAAIRSHQQILALRQSQERLSGAAKGAAELMGSVGSEAELAAAARRLARALFGEQTRLALIDQRDGAAIAIVAEPELRAGRGLADGERLMEILSLARASGLAPKAGAMEVGAELNVQGSRATLWLESPGPLDDTGLAVFSVYSASLGSALSVAKMRESMRAAAYEDGLTLLPNRPKLIMDIDSMRAPERAGLCLLFVDIEGFSGVNDALGYDAGDALLIRLASLLIEAYPEARLFRMPGGAFALLGERGAIDHLKTLALFDEPIHAGDWEFPVKATLGMSYLEAQKSARQTLNESNMALNSAKKAGVSFLEHDSRITRSGQERLRLTRDLKRSLSSETGLRLFYQPQLSMADTGLVGAEALCRWFQPDGSMIPPNRFIPVAEATGLIMPLGRWALFEVGKQVAAWQRSGQEIRVGVNVAAAQLMDPKFCHQLRQMLQETGARPDLIEIEITESAAMREPREVSARLREARELGFKVSIDDFGSGYSSLAQLERMPIDRLKMDRAFVSPLADGHRSLNIARMVAKLAEELGMDVIAEGVETQEQARLLQSVGVGQAQGWLYAPALAPEAFEKWVAELRASRAQRGVSGF